MVMGLYTGELIFGGAYIRNGLSVGEMVGLYLGGAYIWGGLIFGGGAYIWGAYRRFTVLVYK